MNVILRVHWSIYSKTVSFASAPTKVRTRDINMHQRLSTCRINLRTRFLMTLNVKLHHTIVLTTVPYTSLMLDVLSVTVTNPVQSKETSVIFQKWLDFVEEKSHVSFTTLRLSSVNYFTTEVVMVIETDSLPWKCVKTRVLIRPKVERHKNVHRVKNVTVQVALQETLVNFESSFLCCWLFTFWVICYTELLFLLRQSCFKINRRWCFTDFNTTVKLNITDLRSEVRLSSLDAIRRLFRSSRKMNVCFVSSGIYIVISFCYFVITKLKRLDS
ncbi:uncharacterized protein LOC143228741 isoform X3 [Tachypleus tridentatus]|uniref:uncharacterized protein LOC143228741 isoform X3 n=1 Tax=Tachypleus tridentatus TaxID=6853 RepID=UPI003FD3F92C